MQKLIALALVIGSIIFYQQMKGVLLDTVPVQWWSSSMVYGSMRDLKHPTQKELERVQKYLSKGTRSELKFLGEYAPRVRKMKMIGPSQEPEMGTIAVHCSQDERESCLIVYASYNKGFPQGLQQLIHHVSNSDFKGHILYRIGGWPNIEEGDLAIAHVPYAFKPCLFREAKRLGYKKVLWLDTSILPTVSLNQIFDEIEKDGYFAMNNGWTVGPFLNPVAAAALGVSLEEADQISSCSAGLFGVNFSNETASKAIDLWYEKAHDPYAFFSTRSDQNALSIILYQLGLQKFTPISSLTETGQPLSPTTLFTIDRGFVHQ